MARRIFLALPVSERLQSEIETWRARYGIFPIRWLAGKNLHVTLVPPWYESDVESIRVVCRTLEKHFGAIELRFSKVSYGPDPRRPRLVWAEGAASKALLELKVALERGLKRAPERRPFSLHLTVARFREEDFARFPRKDLNETVSWHDTIPAFVIMESHLSRAGADYEILERILL